MNDPFWMAVARRKLAVGPEWEWCSIEAIDKSCRPNARRDILVKGALPTVLIERGPRKGKINWKKVEMQSVVVTQEEEEAEAVSYEEATGNCRRCHGEGREIASCGVGGTTYRECGKCKGSGLSPAAFSAGQSGAPTEKQ